MAEQFAEAWGIGGYAQAEKVQTCESANRTGHFKRNQGHNGGQAVGQDVAADDDPVALPESLGRANVIKRAILEEFGAYVGGYA